jgi:hypothetical protein
MVDARHPPRVDPWPADAAVSPVAGDARERPVNDAAPRDLPTALRQQGVIDDDELQRMKSRVAVS